MPFGEVGSFYESATGVRPMHGCWSAFDTAAFKPQDCLWRRAAEARLIELCKLPGGWDGHNGRPVDASTAEFSATVLAALMIPRVPEPAILPLSYGGVQLEWHRNGWDVEVEIIAPNRMRVLTYDLSNEEEEEFSLGVDLSRLRAAIQVIKL